MNHSGLRLTCPFAFIRSVVSARGKYFDVVVGFVPGSSLDGLSFFLFHIITNTTTAIVITNKITIESGVGDVWSPALSAPDHKRGVLCEDVHSQRSAAATGGLIIYDG